MLMSKSCKPLYPGLFLLGAATALLVFAAPQTCVAALRQGLALCGGPLLEIRAFARRSLNRILSLRRFTASPKISGFRWTLPSAER